MIKGMTAREFDEVLRIGESDPAEAVKRICNAFSSPNKKIKLPCRKIDRREWNLLVALDEQKDVIGTLSFLMSLCQMRFTENDNGSLAVMRIFKPRETQDPKFNFNVYAKFYNRSVFDLHVASPAERTGGYDPVVTPYDTYEGPVFLKHLASWVRYRKIELRAL
jgi:hypothetical protein